jgi:dynein intermediate chain 2
VFLTSKLDGSMDVWDFVFKQNDPTLTLQVASSALQTVKIQEGGRTVAAGARDGSVTIIELSEGLSRMQPSEKTTFSQMLEREAKREKTLENAARDKRLKAAQGKQRAGGSAGKARGDEPSVDELIKKAEEDFWIVTKEEAEQEKSGKGGLVRAAEDDDAVAAPAEGGAEPAAE